MGSTTNVGLDAVLERARLSRFQVGVVVMCGLVALLDGFDTQSIAFAAPDIARDWDVASSAFGLVFGIGLFGGLVGAVISGPLSDRIGRRPVLLSAVALFGVVTLVTPFTGSIGGLVVVRLVTGFGLGAALPGIISITTEYVPVRMRTTAVALMFAGFPLGAALGGLASARLMPSHGWQSVFYLAGIAPLLLLPVLWLRLPESARFLVLRGDREALARVLTRMDLPAPQVEGLSAEPTSGHSPVARLFTDRRAPGTLLLWATLFLSLLLTYFLTNWIPLVARQTGIGAAKAILGVVALNIGAIIGSFLVGRLADRMNATVVIGASFALGALAIAAIGLSGSSAAILLVTAFTAGGLSIGAQMTTVALCADFYETSLRATGVGWSMGVGRVGAITGPVLGGVLIAAGINAPSLFLLTGLASLGAAVAVLALGRVLPRRAPAEDAGLSAAAIPA
jgi:AAHS family 4-hydroxybenzoate transporter-like MFS transporter